MNIPKPSAKFLRAQAEFLELKNFTGSGRPRKDKAEIMEVEFMKAFKLAPDIRKKAARLGHMLVPNGKASMEGLDHCTYYYSLDNAAPAIVTQPYGNFTKQLLETLSLGAWSVPEVVDASDWGFYSPGRANLHIIFFPRGYAEALVAVRRSLRV